MKCENCPHAMWDCETFYNTPMKQFFVSGCKKGLLEEKCEDEEEE